MTFTATDNLLANLLLFKFTITTDSVKEFIGDSTNNNRTLTVNQTIRYLSNQNVPYAQDVGDKLRICRKLLVPYVRTLRELKGNTRTDAMDISEMMELVKLVRNTDVTLAIVLETLLRDRY